MLAPATDTFGTPLWPHAAKPAAPSFLRSIMPALDLAFGLPYSGDAPDALAALIVRLETGPLGGAGLSGEGPAEQVEASPARIRENSLG